MKSSVLLALLLSSIFAQIILNDKIAFVYEVVRHGARAPLAKEPEGYFQVPTE